jgi:hypothetical protein
MSVLPRTKNEVNMAHPRVLLSSAFKPFAVDNLYSRKESIMELLRNQVTKNQGPFCPRTYHNTYGLHTIANNISAPTTVLDFPTLERFRREVRRGYDIVGIGAIMPNFTKVKRMVEETRELSPRSTIVIGGFCAIVPDLDKVMDVDHVCVGEGISFMRDLLGEPAEFKFQNPDVFAENRELLGVPLFGLQQNPHIVVGLGCSYGCDFCNVTHFFGRKHIRFFTNGRDLFAEMLRVEKRFRSNVIVFIGDDNFLIDLDRAEQLRQAVVESGKVFKTMIFGSADRAAKFGPERLAEMGCDTIWIGREGKFSDYRKNRGTDLKGLVAELRRFGIKTILSSILLLDSHTKANIGGDVEDHLACRPVFSQFAHYSPAPGTPLYDRLKEEGRLLSGIPYEEMHAFKQPWFHHPEFTLAEAEQVQEEAYRRDFHELGPSLARYIEVEYEGWLNLKDSPKSHLRARAEAIAKHMWQYRTLLLVTETLAPSEPGRSFARELRARIEADFGPSRLHEKILARGLDLSGRIRQARTRRFGDAIQPRTRVVRYHQSS